MATISPATVYNNPTAPTKITKPAFDEQVDLNLHKSVLDAEPYITQRNVSVFFYAETIFDLIGFTAYPARIAGVAGILFHLVKDGADLALVARSSEYAGSTPIGLANTNWMSTPNQRAATANVWCTSIKAFYADNYALVKSQTTCHVDFTSVNLLQLLCPSGTALPGGARTSLTFHLIFSQDGANWNLNLASVLNGSTPKLYAVEGEECPPNCYPGTLSSAIQNLAC